MPDFSWPATAETCRFDPILLEKLSVMLGPMRIDAHLEELTVQIQWLIDANGDDPQVPIKAHRLISQAGLLGFIGLSRACCALEVACGESGSEHHKALKCAAAIAAVALPEIRELQISSRRSA